MRLIEYISKTIVVFSFLAVLLLPYSVEAVKQPVGSLQATDFGYKGLCLGDSAERLSIIGEEPLFDTAMEYGDIKVKRYTYEHDITVYVSEEDNKVIEIDLLGKKYELRDGVKYGALPYTMIKALGRGQHIQLDGNTCWVYESPDFPGKHIVAVIDSEEHYLISLRITMLPIKADETFESREWYQNLDDEWDSEYHGKRYNFAIEENENV